MKLLEIYHTSKDVFTLQQIEKAGAKVGVVMNTIKDINQELVNDGQIETDKIGSACFFWSFPSKSSQDKAAEATQLAQQVHLGRQEVVKLDKAIEAAGVGRQEHPDRTSKLETLKKLKAENAQLHGRLETLKENDPVEIAKQDKALQQSKEAANRWVDNIIECRTWLVRKRGMSSKEVANTLKQLGVPGELDYLQ